MIVIGDDSVIMLRHVRSTVSGLAHAAGNDRFNERNIPSRIH